MPTLTCLRVVASLALRPITSCPRTLSLLSLPTAHIPNHSAVAPVMKTALAVVSLTCHSTDPPSLLFPFTLCTHQLTVEQSLPIASLSSLIP
ncbi:hypothetical protein B0O80DRAFT_463531 [Mortierella sp. GBAus27b]|nr:hypothetical protein B0O80DRAFT_463531 [Mortierella sp. GBAus27b]